MSAKVSQLAFADSKVDTNDAIEVDVVIIGAGLSGLSAAYELWKRDRSLHIAILEAKDRIGGRTMGCELKTATGSEMWDMGGQWIGTAQKHVMGLIKELGLITYHQYSAGKKLMHIGTSPIRSFVGDLPALSWLAVIDMHLFLRKLERMASQLSVYDPGACEYAETWDSMTLEDMKRQAVWTQETKDAVDIAVRIIFGVEPSQFSLLYFLLYARAAGGVEALLSDEKGGQEFKVEGGAFQLAQRLADKLSHYKLQLNEPVQRIEQLENAVRVQTLKGASYQCKRVILATPPQQTASIEFTPALPLHKRHAMCRMAAGCVTKVIVTYPKAFWRDAGYSGFVMTSGADGTTQGPLNVVFDAMSAHGSPALVTFISARQKIEYSEKSPEVRRKAVLASLATYLGDAALTCVDYTEFDWNDEAYIHGGPMCPAVPGITRQLPSAIRHPFDRIHFAGSESATEWCGFLNGAVQAGYRAAHEVLYNIRPQAIRTGDLDDTCYRLGEPKGERSRGFTRRRWLPHMVFAITVALALHRGWRMYCC